MNISGIGSYIGVGALNHYNKLNQSFGVYDYSDQYRPDSEDTTAGVASVDTRFSIANAISGMRNDRELEQFAMFIPSGASAADNGYRENWARPVENFAL